MWKKFLPILALSLLLTGCATTFTNLTPTRQPRNSDNLYHVEVSFQSQQQTLDWGTIEPYVVVGSQSYPMHKVAMVPDRWEGYVPVPAGTDIVPYRYKFNFKYNTFGPPANDTAISKKFDLLITGNQ